MEKRVKVLGNEKVPFHNAVDFCVGTGRMGLALQKEYYDQLKMVQEEIGFQHIRGHGLFCDDMAIYQEYEVNGKTKVEYNFTYLDRVMDSYLELGIRPFIELGFMPSKLASGTQTIFYWKGNTTPPKSYEMWQELVKATLRHLMERYGNEEVVTWPVEVWNEPNLRGFWYMADMQEYFRLFKATFTAVKEVDERFKVGGPAVCGGSDKPWIKGFMEFCHQEKIPVDFVTRHHYTTELPKPDGHYGYAEITPAEHGFENLHSTREIIDSFEEYKGLPIHITEFNTSYIPNCPLHDTNQNAAYLARQLSRLGEDNESYSYWTFGDVFEEQGVPFTPFHGGFGLVANGCIPKPTFWTFSFFKKLKEKAGKCVYRDDETVVMKLEDGGYRIVAWNESVQRCGKQLKLHYELQTEVELECASGAGGDKKVDEHVQNKQDVEYCIIKKLVDEETCNPLKVWHDLGEPANPSKEQLALIKDGAKPFVETKRVKGEKGVFCLDVDLKEHGVVYFDIIPSKVKSDRGYSYERVMQRFCKNPIVTDIYTADPAPMVHGDRLYLYVTHDEDELINDFYTMLDWRCYSTKDMVNWTDHGVIFSLDDIPWADDRAWAPQAIQRNGKFYLYCPVHKKDGGMAIAVGVSDSPTGPFKDLGYPLVDEGDWNDIDPTVFIDDDGQAYLYFGNPNLRYVLLNEDMISYNQEVGIVNVPMTEESFAKGSHMTGTSYGEGPWFYKRKDIYYMVYAAFGVDQKNEHLAYSTSTSPTGPWVYGGVIMGESGVFTIHPGVVDFKGHSYLFYHTGDLPGGSLFHRSVCVAEFTYNEDGSIGTIEKSDGVYRIEE